MGNRGGAIYGRHHDLPTYRHGYAAPDGAYRPGEDESTGNDGHDANGSLLDAGLRYLKSRQYARAATTLLQTVVADPDAGTPKLAFGDALFATGDYHYAALAVRRGIDRVGVHCRCTDQRASEGLGDSGLPSFLFFRGAGA